MEQTLKYNNTFGSIEQFFDIVSKDIIQELQIGEPNDNWVIDWESDYNRRIFIKTDDDREYTIRLWNIHDDDEFVYVDYTAFFDSPNGVEVTEV
jgi:ethanolamine ammonia-lyase large subunit